MYRQMLRQLFREASFPLEEFGPDHFVISPAVVHELRLLSYFDQWRMALEKKWFHVRAADHSLFLFKEVGTPSYSFIHCPLDLMPFSSYLTEVVGVEDTPSSRRSHRGDYENLFDTASLRDHVSPIRFDYDEVGYRSGVHPVAHVHIGLDNDIRLYSNKMTPVSFVLFVLRQMYPRSWERLLDRANSHQYLEKIRAPATRLNARYASAKDLLELHLS